MRKIKFRGKSVNKDKWLYGYLGEAKYKILKTTYVKKVIFENLSWFNTDNFGYVIDDYMVYEDTIGQFIGLKDDLGHEIYEGDILGRDDSFAVVVYDGDGFIAKHAKWEIKGMIKDLINLGYYVVGNIYDNKDLLED